MLNSTKKIWARRPPQEMLVCDTRWFNVILGAGLHNFDALWRLPKEWIEPVNYRRGGWSGVTRVTLEPGDITLFVKRQENQRRYSLRAPLGQATFFNEYKMLTWLNKIQGPGVNCVLYTERTINKNNQAILLTRGLDARYLDLPRLLARFDRDPKTLNALLEKIGAQLCRLHWHKVQHGALYPNHLFIDACNGDLRLIDFERSYINFNATRAGVSDFKQLIRRSDWLSWEHLTFLLKAYHTRLPELPRKVTRFYHQYQEDKS